MSAARPVDARIVLAGLAAVLVVAWLCYRPALSGAFELDDLSNLSGLAYVQDADSALDFTLSGDAGPTGRPLALLTFALQADAWEEGASAFLNVNLLIHLLNALLLAWCLFQLASLSSVERRNALLVAAAAASVWVTMPLLASASLLVVQRMTTLSATFALLGLGGYLLARKALADNPVRGFVGMSGSLVAGTVLSALCKESGLLLPVFVLVIESTILGRPASVAKRTWRLWQSVFLALPLIAILLFLASRAG